MISENRVRELVGEKIIGTDYYILDVQIGLGNNISIEIESLGPVSIQDCVEISRQVEHNLDREEEDFSLQVGSPGVDKPLRDYRQYIKNIGREIKLKLADGEEAEGEIKQADEDGVTVFIKRKERVEGKKKKVVIEEDKTFRYSEIKQAKIKISFK